MVKKTPLWILMVGIPVGAWLTLAIIYGSLNPETKNSKNQIQVLTYHTFASRYGPGPSLIEAFEKSSDLRVDLKSVDFIGGLPAHLDRFPLQKFDLILGLDQYEVAEILANEAWKIKWRALFKIQLEENHPLPKKLTGNESFVPYNWSPLSFIVKEDRWRQVESLEELLQEIPNKSLSLMDPRFSLPGLLFFDFFEPLLPDTRQTLKAKALGLFPSWSQSYGFFNSGQAEITWSFVTSLMYHLKVEKKSNYSALRLRGGHPISVEYFAQPMDCLNCKGGLAFAKFLMSREGQEILMNKNYMLPTRTEVTRGTPFEDALSFPVKSLEIGQMKKAERGKKYSEAFRGSEQ